MGSWSNAIFGNDTAADSMPEFQAIFSGYGDEEAIALLTEYGRNYVDDGEAKDYLYALSLFLWQKGRLTDGIRLQALQAIQSDGLARYREAGQRALEERQRVLSELSLTLQSPQPPRKEIKADFLRRPFCRVGDAIALKLRRSGKYILIQCVSEEISFQSKVDPTLRATYPHFVLLSYYSAQRPSSAEIQKCAAAKYSYEYCEYDLDGKTPVAVEKSEERKYFFYCEWKKRPLQERGYEILGNFPLVTPHERYGKELDICNLWRENDELQMERCVLSQLKIQSHWQGLKNRDALDWLKVRNREIEELWGEFTRRLYHGQLPEGTSFYAFAKSSGYWNEQLG